VVAAVQKGIKPSVIHHRSVSATRQGMLFGRNAFEEMGVGTTFYSVGEADELNIAYYLVGDRCVGDAGHLLRYFLPNVNSSRYILDF
jgi:hypothetical protein